jgi:hypothetical protein
MITQAQLMKLKFAGSAQSRVQALYVADTFLSVSTAAEGDTDVWAAANDVLLLGFNINGGVTLAVPGELVITLHTETTDQIIAIYSVLVGATETNFNFNSNYPDGYGMLTVDIPTTVQVNLSVAPATGHVNVNLFGAQTVFPNP